MSDYEHPVITNMERWGTPDGKAVMEPRCPVCGGRQGYVVFRNLDGQIVGCNECLKVIDPWDCPECFEGRDI